MSVKKFVSFNVVANASEKEALTVAMKANTARLNTPDVDVWVYFQAPVAKAVYEAVVPKLEEGIFLACVDESGKMVAKQIVKKAVASNPVTTNIKEKVENTMNKGKELVEKAKGFGFIQSVKSLSTATWNGIKKGYEVTKGFVKKQASTMGITAGAVVVGGAVTTTATTAVAVGAGIALTVLMAKALIKKKKEQAMSGKDLLVSSLTVLGTAMVLPCALYVAAGLALSASIFGLALPYAIIVA